MHIPEPDNLEDEEWASMIKILEYIKRKEKEAAEKQEGKE